MINRRFFQVLRWGGVHAKQLSDNHPLRFIMIYMDIIYNYIKYKMWSNEYVAESFHLVARNKRKAIGQDYFNKGIIRESWEREDERNMRFLAKYSDIKYSRPSKKHIRQNAYMLFYRTGKNLMVEENVIIAKHHYLNGKLTIGNNVFFGRSSHVDYSGNLTIGDNVRITDGVKIETHYHSNHSDWRINNKAVPSSLVIKEDAVIGLGAIILASCNYIGKHSRIGAGAVVTHDVPDNVIVAGVPARIINEIK